MIDAGMKTRDRLLLAASQLFLEKGYYGTSISDIANACGIKKPSVFHYFSSKEEIALSTIEFVRKQCHDNIFHKVEQAESGQAARVCYETLREELSHNALHQLIGFLARELKTVPVLFNAMQGYYQQWSHFLKANLSLSEAMVRRWLLSLHGALGMYRITSDQHYLETFFDQVAGWLNLEA